MKPIDAEGFERRFRFNIDPWNYATSPFESFKRQVLLRACGCRTYGRGLELGCAIGETTRYLAPRCLRLLAVDASLTALDEARKRTAGTRGVSLRQALLPQQTPRGRFDLIVASEIVYYLRSHAMNDLLRRLCKGLAPGGRMVFLHHLRPFDDAAQPPQLAHSRIRAALKQSMQLVFAERHARYEALAFQ
jgi:cyclopropane fatty-acyl-phospholipid synthase-like methyltransferase